MTWSVHSCRAEPIKRSTRPFCQGERNDVGRSRIPIARTRVLNTAPKARSLSRMRYFGARVPWERFSDLAYQPLGRRVAGHRKPQQLPTFVAENKTCEELLKRNRRNHEQIDRRDPLHMIAKEGLPSLQWPIPPRYYVDGNRGLGDRDTEFEQFAVDLGRAPQRILKTHSSDQLAHLSGDPRPAPGRAGLPSPIAGKTLAMPAHDSLRPDDAQGIKNARVATIEPDEQDAVDPTQMQSPARRSLLQDVELMPQYQDFGFQPQSRLEEVAQHAGKQEADRNHSAIMF